MQKSIPKPCSICRRHHIDDIATDFDLWRECIDTSGIDTDETFSARSFDENLTIIEGCGMRDECYQDID